MKKLFVFKSFFVIIILSFIMSVCHASDTLRVPVRGVQKIDEVLKDKNQSHKNRSADLRKTKEHRLAAFIFDTGLKHDPEGYGYISFEKDGFGRAPRFGKPMEDAISSIERYRTRHFGDEADNFTDDVYIFGSGIGGQMTCAIPAKGFIVKHRNRELIVCDSLGTNYKAYEEKMVSALRTNPNAKFLWVVGSKSGTTDETMVNFQMNLALQIRVLSRVFYGDDSTVAHSLIAKLLDSNPLFDKRVSDLNLAEGEARVLREVFKNLIAVTGSWDEEKQSGSRIDRLVKSFLDDLYDNPEDRVISILMLPNLGGRFQGISPNAFVYNALLGMDIRSMLEGARVLAVEQRENPEARSGKVAEELYKNEVNHLLIGMPNDIIFGNLSETLGQIIPESLGKGRRIGNRFGIQTYAYDSATLNRAFKNIKPSGKAYLVIDIKGREPMTLGKDIEENNLIVRYTIDSVSEPELAKLIQFVEDITARVGILNTAKALLDAQEEDASLAAVDVFDEKTIIKIMRGPSEGDEHFDVLQKLHGIYNEITPFRQPDVEFAKRLVKGETGAGVKRFNPQIVLNDGGLPVRDEAARKRVYGENNAQVSEGAILDKSSFGLRSEDGDYKTGKDAEAVLSAFQELLTKPEAGGEDVKTDVIKVLAETYLLQSDISKSGIPLDSYDKMDSLKTKRNAQFSKIKDLLSKGKLTPRQEETASELAALLIKMHREGKSLNFVLYDDRNNRTDILKRYLEFIGVDRFDFGPAEQHKSFQLTSGGVDVSGEVFLHSVKDLDEVRQNRDTIISDGCVPDYLHGLYPSEVAEIYLRAYSDRFRQKEVSTETAVLMSKDLTENGNIADVMAVFTRMMQIYEANAPLTEKGISIKSSRDTQAGV